MLRQLPVQVWRKSNELQTIYKECCIACWLWLYFLSSCINNSMIKNNILYFTHSSCFPFLLEIFIFLLTFHFQRNFFTDFSNPIHKALISLSYILLSTLNLSVHSNICFLTVCYDNQYLTLWEGFLLIHSLSWFK